MKGGASTRRFFRIALGKKGGSAVAMFTPGAPSHEIHKDGGHARSPFLEVRDLLAERGVRVPKLFADGSEQGWVVVEDLGDETLANYLVEHPQQKRDIYRRAVRDLARAQQRLVRAARGVHRAKPRLRSRSLALGARSFSRVGGHSARHRHLARRIGRRSKRSPAGSRRASPAGRAASCIATTRAAT